MWRDRHPENGRCAHRRQGHLTQADPSGRKEVSG